MQHLYKFRYFLLINLLFKTLNTLYNITRHNNRRLLTINYIFKTQRHNLRQITQRKLKFSLNCFLSAQKVTINVKYIRASAFSIRDKVV